MVLSKTVLLLFGLMLCAILIAILTRNYNDTLCAHVSDLVKIKKEGGNYLTTSTGKKLYQVNSKGYRDYSKKYKGGLDSEPDVEALNFQEYNRGFRQEFKEDKHPCQNIILKNISNIKFPSERTF